MGFFSSNKCVRCGSPITQNAPVSGKIGMVIAQKFSSGQMSGSEVDNFYKSLGAICPSCGKLYCSYCYDDAGRKCPSCSSRITYFV